MERSCSCFMVHVRCGIIVLNTVSFPLVNTFRKTKLNYPQQNIFVEPGWLWSNECFVSLPGSVFVGGGDDRIHHQQRFEMAWEKMWIWNEEAVTLTCWKKRAAAICKCGGTVARQFLSANGSISIGWTVYPVSLQPGHREGPANVINALPCRRGGGCLSAVSFSFPVLLPDISLMWLDNEEIDSDHYAALKE